MVMTLKKVTFVNIFNRTNTYVMCQALHPVTALSWVLGIPNSVDVQSTIQHSCLLNVFQISFDLITKGLN